ncbi:hypothetical protein [Pseudovibrio sp. Ad26]|uniref:hypothetical protein n=1 Tax=Pseudovibrio sp. Ad26 TaxID=989410 RepID=UPI00129084BB|nr:hypothetical protein [Pseudovibrio sp. Ad26]
MLLTSTAAGFSQTGAPPTPAAQAAGAGKQGQIGQQATSAAQATAALREKLFAVAVKQTTPIFEGKAVELALQIKKAPQFTAGVNKDEVSVAGVSAEGFSQYVMHDGKKIGQAVLTRLTKGERFVELNAENFSSQFDVEEDVIDPEETLDVSGNEEELIAALKKLNAQEEPEDDKDKDKEEDEEKYEDVERDENGGSGAGSGSSDGGETPGQGGYETPDRKEVEEKDAPEEDLEEIRVTFEGCSPVIDRNQGQVRVQSKTQTLKKGIVVEESACSDSGTNFTIQKSGATCDDKIDVTARIAKPQYLEYYVNSQQERIQLSDCQPDPDTTFSITEDDSCPIDIDLQNGMAYIETQMVYTDGNNNLQTVRTCERSQFYQPIKMAQVTDGCNIRHDFGNSLSTEMAMWIYQKDDQFFQASPCSVTENTYPHEKVFKKNGVDICQTMVDLSGRRAIPQYRTQITVGGASQYIDQCTPDSNASIEIKSTTEGCINPAEFNHDIAAGVSYGLERHYFENPTREYVSSCQQGGTTYVHNVDVSSWKHNDEKKVAQPLSDVSINVAGQVYPIASNMMLPGAPEVAYTKLETEAEQVASGRYFEGCYAFVPTRLTDVFERPDSTRLEVPLGDGEVFEEGYQCKPTIEGCISPADFTHDFTAGVSTGLERFYYTNPDRVYVGNCQKGDTNYTHIAQTSAWKYDDPKRKARPLSDVSIKIEGLSYTIATKKLLPNAQYVAYTKKNIEEVEAPSERYYEGCNAMVPVQRNQVYERPDGSKHSVTISNGTPVNEGDKCERSKEQRKRYIRTKFEAKGYGTLYSYNPSGKVRSMDVSQSWGWNGNGHQWQSFSDRTDGEYQSTGCRVVQQNCTGRKVQGRVTNVFANEERDVLTLPDGKVEYSEWKEVSRSEPVQSCQASQPSRYSDSYCDNGSDH